MSAASGIQTLSLEEPCAHAMPDELWLFIFTHLSLRTAACVLPCVCRCPPGLFHRQCQGSLGAESLWLHLPAI